LGDVVQLEKHTVALDERYENLPMDTSHVVCVLAVLLPRWSEAVSCVESTQILNEVAYMGEGIKASPKALLD
jgi:hypothetical protein